MAGINNKIGSISSKVHYPYEGIFGKASPGPAYIVKEVTGNGYVNLTNAVANHLMELKAYGGIEQRNLPKGYTQYEYLRSSGTQYIDLGYKGNGDTKVEVKFKYYQTSSATGSGRVFGSRITSSSNAFAIGTSSGIVNASGNKVFWCYDGQSFYVADDVQFGLDEWKTVIFSATEHKVDGITKGDDYEITEFETPNNLLLFAFDNNGTVGVGYVDIAYCKLWNNGVLVRDLIPCKNGSNVIGMYDRVSETLLTNAGTGTFETGNTATPTPDEPMNIVSNNGVLKFSKNMANVNEQTIQLGYYISSSGVVTADANNRIYQEYIPVLPNTTYTLSLSSEVYYVTISEYSTADDSGFIRRNAGSSGGNTQLTITTGTTTNYLRFGTNIDRTEVTLERVLAINWMLNKGDTMPYTPYSPTGIYTDGTTETIGVNLLDLSNVDNGHYYSGTGEYLSVDAAMLSNFVSVKAGDTLSITIQVLSGSTLNLRYNFFDTSKQWLSQSTYSLSISEGEHTEVLTVQQDGYFAFSGNYTGSGTILDWNNVVIMDNEKNVTAEMLLKIGDYVDEQEILSGDITRKVGIMVLDGVTAGKKIGTAWNSTYKRGSFAVSDIASTASSVSDAISSHFEYSSSIYGAPTTNGFCTNNGSIFISFLGLDNITSAETANQWLATQYNAGTPVILVYPLATPTTESVAGQTMHIPAGNSTIEITQASIDNLGLYAKYKATE